MTSGMHLSGSPVATPPVANDDEGKGPWLVAAPALVGGVVGAGPWYLSPLPLVGESFTALAWWALPFAIVTGSLVALVVRFLPDFGVSRLLVAAESRVGTQGIVVVAMVLGVLLLVGALVVTAPLKPLAGIAIVMLAASVSGPFARPLAERQTPVVPEGEEPDDPSQFIRRELRWDLDEIDPDLSGHVGLWISRERAAQFRSTNPVTKQHPDGSAWPAWYVTEGRCSEVDWLVDVLAGVSGQLRLDPFAEVTLCLDIVQSLPYAGDRESTGREEYWRFPLETLADGEGDCEDKSILLIALLSGLGYRTCFLDCPGHIAVGVAGLDDVHGLSLPHSGRNYLYAESTADGRVLGELPEDVAADSVSVIDIVEPLDSRREVEPVARDRGAGWAKDARLLWWAGISAVVVALVLPWPLWWR